MDNLRNINMIASSGLKVVIKINKNKTISDLFRAYIKRVGVGEIILEKKLIVFLFNAQTIEPNDQRKIEEVFPKDMMTITVIDQNNVIGAKIY